MDSTLIEFLQSTNDIREYQRALAVQMVLRGDRSQAIQQVIPVSKAFISKWNTIYAEQGVEGLRMGYRGSQGYLTAAQRAETLAWIAKQSIVDVPRLRAYLAEQYEVHYRSDQSYYAFLHEAGFAWKKGQSSNPKKTITTSPPNTRK